MENNPFRAGIVQDPEGPTWSSARGDCVIVSDGIPSDTCHLCDGIDEWSRYLRDDESAEVIERLKLNVMSGRPCGDGDFRKSVEVVVGRPRKQ